MCRTKHITFYYLLTRHVFAIWLSNRVLLSCSGYLIHKGIWSCLVRTIMNSPNISQNCEKICNAEKYRYLLD